jgi:hypothetical protein
LDDKPPGTPVHFHQVAGKEDFEGFLGRGGAWRDQKLKRMPKESALWPPRIGFNSYIPWQSSANA